MNRTNEYLEKNQEDIKMRKLIVEAPELRKGQRDSSGGIRENGKIAVQYKNPVPYVEPELSPAAPQRKYTRKDILMNQAKDFAMDIGSDLVTMLWYEYGRPFIQAKLHQLGQKAVAYFETVSDKDVATSKVIDADYIEIPESKEVEGNDRIISFPNRQAG